MAPSRGSETSEAAPSSTSHTTVSPRQTHALQQEHNATSTLRRNLSYLYNPGASTSTDRPARLRTRALLHSLRSIGIFLYWRAVRWAKYAAVGAVVGALGSFAFAGSLASGVGAVVAPTGVLASIAVGGVWWVGRWAWGRYVRRGGRGREVGKVMGERRVHPAVAGREPELVPW